MEANNDYRDLFADESKINDSFSCKLFRPDGMHPRQPFYEQRTVWMK